MCSGFAQGNSLQKLNSWLSLSLLLLLAEKYQQQIASESSVDGTYNLQSALSAPKLRVLGTLLAAGLFDVLPHLLEMAFFVRVHVVWQ